VGDLIFTGGLDRAFVVCEHLKDNDVPTTPGTGVRTSTRAVSPLCL